MKNTLLLCALLGIALFLNACPATYHRNQVQDDTERVTVGTVQREIRLGMSGASKCNSFEGSFYQARIDLSGASRGSFDIKAEDWDVVLSGSANVDLRGPSCRTLDIESSGASKADVAVLSDALQYEGSGSSDLHALDAPTRKAKIEISGASSARVAVRESLEVEASGASTCRYKAVDNAALKTKFDVSRGSRVVSL